MKKLIILNYPALNLKRQPPPLSHHDHVCRLWRITCCTITAFKILCPLSCLYSIGWWSLKSSIYLERPRVLNYKIKTQRPRKTAHVSYSVLLIRLRETVGEKLEIFRVVDMCGQGCPWSCQTWNLCVDKNGIVQFVIMNET